DRARSRTGARPPPALEARPHRAPSSSDARRATGSTGSPHHLLGGGTKSGGSAAPSPKKNASHCSRRRSWAFLLARSRRYSLTIIFEGAIHIFQASIETWS